MTTWPAWDATPPSILRHDALDFIANISSHNPGFVPDSLDLVLANPPWRITIRRSEREAQYLDQYELQNFTGKRWPTLSKPDSPAKAKPRASARSEILFLEHIHSLLKPGTGRAAIIVPMGILASDMLQGLRSWLKHHFQIQGVIQLPNHTFYSSGLNVGAGIIFVRRLDSGETNPEDALVFMAMLENIGFGDHGRNTFKITAEQATDTLKTERHQSDLFDYRISFARDAKGGRHRAWIEQHRDIIPGTGLIGLWESFQDSPKSFLI